MTRKTITLALACLLISIAHTGCNNADKSNKPENITEGQNNADDAYKNEWDKFKIESDEQIRNNDNYITSYRDMEKKDKDFSSRYKNKIDELEAENTRLRAKLNESNTDKIKENWAEFKREFKHDMDELGHTLKDLTVNNTN